MTKRVNVQHKIKKITQVLNQIILGKEQVIEQALVCLFANGHLLIEDVPGTGKTTFSYALAKVLGMNYQRIQFTGDLLPADLSGVSIYKPTTHEFEFHPGPIFNQLVLADEVNRATPKTQSALLEAMEERQVSIDGKTYKLPQPFFVIATQNPGTQIGTFDLPESQLDRFLMRLSMGELDRTAERKLLLGEKRSELLKRVTSIITPQELIAIQQQVQQIKITPALVDYLQKLLHHSRHSEDFEHGLSPRAGLGVKAAAQAQALISGRDFVTPEDVQAVIIPIAIHRLLNMAGEQYSSEQLHAKLIQKVAIE